MKQTSTPPPRFCSTKSVDEPDNEIPSFHLGRLIFHEPWSDDACKWVVYDGRQRVRCYSRAAALQYIEERKDHIVDLGVAQLLDVVKTLGELWPKVDRISALIPKDRAELQAISVYLRRVENHLTMMYTRLKIPG